MRLPEISKTIQVPEDVDVSLEGKKVKRQRRQRVLNT